jgi:anti-sigma B factor antagonist
MFEIRWGGEGDLKLIGRLDASAAEGAMAALKDLDCSVTADCAALEYISSAGLGVIMTMCKQLRGRGLTLTLVNLSPHVRNIFRYSGLDLVIEIR